MNLGRASRVRKEEVAKRLELASPAIGGRRVRGLRLSAEPDLPLLHAIGRGEFHVSPCRRDPVHPVMIWTRLRWLVGYDAHRETGPAACLLATLFSGLATVPQDSAAAEPVELRYRFEKGAKGSYKLESFFRSRSIKGMRHYGYQTISMFVDYEIVDVVDGAARISYGITRVTATRYDMREGTESYDSDTKEPPPELLANLPDFVGVRVTMTISPRGVVSDVVSPELDEMSGVYPDGAIVAFVPVLPKAVAVGGTWESAESPLPAMGSVACTNRLAELDGTVATIKREMTLDLTHSYDEAEVESAVGQVTVDLAEGIPSELRHTAVMKLVQDRDSVTELEVRTTLSRVDRR